MGPSISYPIYSSTSNLRGASSNVGATTPKASTIGAVAYGGIKQPDESPAAQQVLRQEHVNHMDTSLVVQEATPTGGNATIGIRSDSSFSIKHEVLSTSGGVNIYTPTPGGNSLVKPVASPRANTLTPHSSRQSEETGSPHHKTTSFADYGGARKSEILENGSTKPQQTPSDYDFLAPRKAVSRTPSSPEREHPVQQRDGTPTVDDDNHMYVNVRWKKGTGPPPLVDRSSKPELLLPRVERNLKPKSIPTDTAPSKSSPSIFHSRKASDMADDSPTHITSSSSSNSLSSFNESDIPKRSNHTMHYTQVDFDQKTKTPKLPKKPEMLDNSSPMVTDMTEKGPIPSPGPSPRLGVGCVLYMDVDLDATRALAAAKRRKERNQITLNEAEQQSLKEKPYINVVRGGAVDDDSDPDYYTHMRVRPREVWGWGG